MALLLLIVISFCVSFAILCDAVGRMASTTVSVLQWNPHWECFDDDDCKENAEADLNAKLPQYNISFANIIELEDAAYTLPTRWQKIDNTCGRDLLWLLYDSSRWQPAIGSGAKGCMVDQDRPFVVQLFEVNGGGDSVIVAGAHFPHGSEGYKELRPAILSVMEATGVCSFILIADTNMDSSVTSASIMKHLQIPDAQKYSSSELLHTCCMHDGFQYTFDRIITNAGVGQATIPTTLLHDPVPAWVLPSSSFHKGVIGTFALQAAACDSRFTKLTTPTTSTPIKTTTSTTATPIIATPTTSTPITATMTTTTTMATTASNSSVATTDRSDEPSNSSDEPSDPAANQFFHHWGWFLVVLTCAFGLCICVCLFVRRWARRAGRNIARNRVDAEQRLYE